MPPVLVRMAKWLQTRIRRALALFKKISKDASGKPYGEELAEAQEGVFSVVSYLSPHPGADKTPVQKIAFVTKVSGYICLVGYAP